MASTKAHHLLAFLIISSMAQWAVFAGLHATTNGQDLISTTCKQTLYFDVCMSSLRSNPLSQTADLEGLAAISINLTMAYATEMITHVTDLKGHVKTLDHDTFMAGCLNDCLDEYADAVENLRQSAEALGQRSYGAVNDLVSGAMTDSDTCEEGFTEVPGNVSPLTEKNEYFFKLCSISLAITKLLA
ncbi:putative invertase inhibitor [Magnolia sinica]|uniref:putative invertase inhibitor n=1 Tax=Magnolia sinica TaxID=86752 RepID=UPI0026599C21|nr:putative invertase inhibitor [Magnolia sinica]